MDLGEKVERGANVGGNDGEWDKTEWGKDDARNRAAEEREGSFGEGTREPSGREKHSRSRTGRENGRKARERPEDRQGELRWMDGGRWRRKWGFSLVKTPQSGNYPRTRQRGRKRCFDEPNTFSGN